MSLSSYRGFFFCWFFCFARASFFCLSFYSIVYCTCISNGVAAKNYKQFLHFFRSHFSIYMFCSHKMSPLRPFRFERTKKNIPNAKKFNHFVSMLCFFFFFPLNIFSNNSNLSFPLIIIADAMYSIIANNLR